MDNNNYPALAAADFGFSLIDRVLVRLEAAAAEMLDLERQVHDVEEQGITDATPWWKDGKYLVLVHPQVNGARKREYVGANPDRVQAALLTIENKKRHADLTGRLKFARNRYQLCERELSETCRRIINQR